MSAFPISDIGGSWEYSHAPPTATSATGIPGFPEQSVGGLQLPFPGYTYVGASPLTQPRRHFPNSTPVLGNYAGLSSDREGIATSLNPYISKFSANAQWPISDIHQSKKSVYIPEERDVSNQFQTDKQQQQQFMKLPDPQMQVQLCDKELWDQFSRAGTEMIVTKTGRRMFPGYRIKISGLDPTAKYCVMLDIVNVDDHRYKFQHGEWTVAGRGEPHLPQRFFLHPNSPANGSKWMSEIISFHKVKLTNSIGRDVDGKIVLNSMHRYQPRVHIVRTDDISSVHMQRLCTFAFPQTVFITVTAYQNSEVTKLKIDNNPFAKGFREDGARAKKPRNQHNHFSDNDTSPYSEQRRSYFEPGSYTHLPYYNNSPMNVPSHHHYDNQTMNREFLPEAKRNRIMPESNSIHAPSLSVFHPGNENAVSQWQDVPDLNEMYNANDNNYNSVANQSIHNVQYTQNGITSHSPVQPVPHDNSFTYYNSSSPSSSDSNQSNVNASFSVMTTTHASHSINDIMRISEHADVTSPNINIPNTVETNVHSSDSGIGSSPPTPSDDDASNLIPGTEEIFKDDGKVLDGENLPDMSDLISLTERKESGEANANSHTEDFSRNPACQSGDTIESKDIQTLQVASVTDTYSYQKNYVENSSHQSYNNSQEFSYHSNAMPESNCESNVDPNLDWESNLLTM